MKPATLTLALNPPMETLVPAAFEICNGTFDEHQL